MKGKGKSELLHTPLYKK